ncbi:MAG: tetratricopeptide repeat protein [Cyclobacteriaceae bacterium]|nr:tetratricopeptide repeat protein [Cyclobacteriaceae bacterium]MCH8516313.1 tetratricopeptide repeat protein [Cyclobacteriaceae bacterium]
MPRIIILSCTLFFYASGLLSAQEELLDEVYDLYLKAEYESAIAYIDQGMKAYPQEAEFHYMKGIILLEMKQKNKATEYFKSTLELDPYFTDARVELGTSYFLAHQFEAAKEQYLIALKQEPEHIEALMNIGTVYIELENYEKACESWTKLESLGGFLPQEIFNEYCK